MTNYEILKKYDNRKDGEGFLEGNLIIVLNNKNNLLGKAKVIKYTKDSSVMFITTSCNNEYQFNVITEEEFNKDFTILRILNNNSKILL